MENNNNLNYNLYECIGNCGNEVDFEGTKECLSKCDENYYLYHSSSPGNHICYRTCSSTDKPFSTVVSETDNKKICDITCNGNNKNYGNNKICVSNCNSFPGNKTINESNNECISQSDLAFYHI